MKKITFLKTSLLAAAVSLLAACGGGDGDSSSGGSATATSTGVLTDAAIGGVAYTTSPSNLSGTTNGNGEFQFRAGDTVRFTVGGATLQVPAAARLTPATIAAQLFDDAEDIANATINLAVLFQTLDNDPGAAINVDNSITLTGFAPATALAQAPATFTTTLDTALPAGVDPVSPQEAIEHYYSNELVGTWKAATLKETIVYGGREETDVEDSSTSDNLGFLFSFDPQGRFIFSTWDTVAATDSERRGDIAIGHVVYPETGTRVALGGHATRRLLDGIDISATDANEVLLDPENVSIALEGDQLVVTVHWTDDWDEDGTEDSITSVLSLQRLQNQKNSLIGAWAEYDGDDVDDESVQLNADGTLDFGSEVQGWFHYYVSNSILVMVVLDLDAAGEVDEQNGLIVMNYTRNGNTITLGDIKYDGVSRGEGQVLSSALTFTHGPVSANGRTAVYDYGEDDQGSMSRILSRADLSTFVSAAD